MSKATRRSFLTSAAAGAATVAAAPLVWTPRRARAQSSSFGAAEHVMILFARGGLRSHCMFNAVGTPQHNPFGRLTDAAPSDWRPGALLGSTDYDTSLGLVPATSKITGDIAVVACVDHVPSSPVADTDHGTAGNRIGTGAPLGTTGILSLIGKDHPRYASGFGTNAVPPVEIGQSSFGAGAAEYAAARPLSLVETNRSFLRALEVGKGWKIQARNAMNLKLRERRAPALHPRLSAFISSKRYATIFADMLSAARLDVLGDAAATDAGVTNEQLLSVLGNYNLDSLGDSEPRKGWGADVAKALRFFSFGAPMAVVTKNLYDTHDNERRNLPPRAADLSRQLAGLNFLLKRMSHPRGGTYWERTVVVVVSEFSRNNTTETGFNSGNGSDHVTRDAGPCRNQAIAFMGGPVKAGGQRIGATDEAMNATGEVFSTRSLLSTFLSLVGVDHTKYWTDPPIDDLFT